MKKEKNEITLQGLVSIFLPKWWFILIVSLLVASILGGLSYMKKDSFTSNSKYMMKKINYNDSNALTGLTTGEVDAMHIMISNAYEMINTDNFAEKINLKLREQYDITVYSNSELRKMMSIKLTSADTTCYYFSVTSPNPEHSYTITSLAGDLLVEEFKNNTAYAVEITNLDNASIPKEPNDKGIIKNALIGFAGGFVVAVALIFVISRFDVVIRNRDKIEENFDLPILGVIPRYESN